MSRKQTIEQKSAKAEKTKLERIYNLDNNICVQCKKNASIVYSACPGCRSKNATRSRIKNNVKRLSSGKVRISVLTKYDMERFAKHETVTLAIEGTGVEYILHLDRRVNIDVQYAGKLSNVPPNKPPNNTTLQSV